MSDCRVPEPQGYDVCRLRIEFQGDEIPWMYPLALNGRSIQGVFVDSERYERVRECELEHHETGWVSCRECNTSWKNDRPHVYRRCPYCGARVRGGGE